MKLLTFVILFFVIVFLAFLSLSDKIIFLNLAVAFGKIDIPVSSEGKIVAFFMIIISISIIYFYISKMRLKKINFLYYVKYLLLFFSIALLFNIINSTIFLNVANHLYKDYFYQKFNYQNYTESVSLEFISFKGESTHFFTIEETVHSHETRSILFAVLKSTGMNQLIPADIGESVFYFQNAYVIFTLGILLLLFLFLYFKLIESFLKLIINQKAMFQFTFIPVFIIGSFQLIHSMFDGGFFVSFWLEGLLELVFVSVLLLHLISKNIKFLFLYAIILSLVPLIFNMYYSISFFSIEPLKRVLSISLITKFAALIGSIYLFFYLILGKKLSIKKYFIEIKKFDFHVIFFIALVLLALFSPMPSFSFWTIFDPLLSQSSNYQLYNNQTIIEITIFKTINIDNSIFNYTNYSVGNIHVYYLNPIISVSQKYLRDNFLSLNSPVQTFKGNFKDLPFNLDFYMITENPIGIPGGIRIPSGEYVYKINEVYAVTPAQAAYSLAFLNNSKVIIVSFKQDS